MKTLLLILSLVFILSSCLITAQNNNETSIELIAESDNLWTGMAISKNGRIFVNFPRWSPDVPISVGEIVNGKVLPYPNEELNSWKLNSSEEKKFICVQSVYVDDKNFLWVLDPANPFFNGVVEQGAKLYKINLKTDRIIKTFNYNSDIVLTNSYLNDIRVDTKKEIAYITDSGTGAIIVTNLNSGESIRFLENHYSVLAHFDELQFGGQKISLKVHSDGIALDNSKEYLYYIPLTSHTLYRIKTKFLLNGTATGENVEKVTDLEVATDGIMFDNKNNLYLGGLENNSIYILTKKNTLVRLINGPKIKWADSFAKDKDGNMYFTTSQLNLPPDMRSKFCIYKINLKN